MHISKQKDCCWFIGIFTLVNGICVVVLSCLLITQTATLLIKQRSQKEFETVHKEPFKNNNWMKSAIPLVVVSAIGIFIGTLQSVSSLICLVLDYSKSAQLRKLGWLMWIAVGMSVFTLSSLSFALAIVLKVHEYRDPTDSVSFWTNYRIKEVTHNFEGHAFCSALALNCACLLGSMAVVSGTVFRHRENHPHLLLGM